MQNTEGTKLLLDNSVLYYIITTGMDGNYSFINDHYAREFSHISPNFVGQPYHITMHPDDRKTCAEVAAKCFENPERLYPATIRKHDGKGGYVYTQWEYKAMFDHRGDPEGIFCLGYDITKYVDEKMELKSVQQKNIKNMDIIDKITFQQSHLVRSPLSNIIGLVNNLDKSAMDTNNRNICDMILESTRQLDDVIRQIVTTART